MNGESKDWEKEGFIERVLSDRLLIINKTIEYIIQLIDERENIQEKFISDLNTQILKARNLILQSEPMIPSYIQINPIMKDFEKEVFKLEKAKVDERVNCWRDVVQLKRDLIDLVMKIHRVRSREKIINS